MPEDRAFVSVFDRGFLYGDGLFEGIRVFRGKPFRWQQHLERFQRGAAFLKITIPFSPEKLGGGAFELVTRNHFSDGILRITLTRGVGMRGYSPRGANKPTLVMSLHQLGDSHQPLRLITSPMRVLANDPLAQFKTSTKLTQVLARAQADEAGADEALLINTDGFVAEATSANVFWVEGETVCTPPLAASVLPGITRAAVLEICRAKNIPTRESNITGDQLTRSGGAFLSFTSRGVAEIESIDGKKLNVSPIIKDLKVAYDALLQRECS